MQEVQQHSSQNFGIKIAWNQDNLKADMGLTGKKIRGWSDGNTPMSQERVLFSN